MDISPEFCLFEFDWKGEVSVDRRFKGGMELKCKWRLLFAKRKEKVGNRDWRSTGVKRKSGGLRGARTCGNQRQDKTGQETKIIFVNEIGEWGTTKARFHLIEDLKRSWKRDENRGLMKRRIKNPSFLFLFCLFHDCRIIYRYYV